MLFQHGVLKAQMLGAHSKDLQDESQPGAITVLLRPEANLGLLTFCYNPPCFFYTYFDYRLFTLMYCKGTLRE